jgi:hypothetical protein
MVSRVKDPVSASHTPADVPEQPHTPPHTNWLEAELLACGVPVFGLDQWLRHFMEEALGRDMPDGELLNFFCLARDKALGDDPDFIEILNRTEERLFARMSGRPEASTGDQEADQTSFDADEHADALHALCAGTLTDRQLVELFDLSATLRGEADTGHMWLAVMFLSRVQILHRIKRARQRTSPDAAGQRNDELSRGESHGHAFEEASPRRANRPAVALPVIPWMTHAYEVAVLAFQEDMPDGQLLDLLQMADWLRNYELNGLNATEWNQMRRDAANMIMRRIVGPDCPPLSDRWPHDTRAWRMNEFRDAKHRLPELDAATLIHLYMQTGENAYLCAREPLQGEWEAVGEHCRTEILRRMTVLQSTQASRLTHFIEAPHHGVGAASSASAF